MKNKLLLIFGLINMASFSQKSEELDVRQTIDDFFMAFHAKDSVAMNQVVNQTIVLQTIEKNNEGIGILKTERFLDMIAHITSIPDSISFEERLTDYNIQIDGNMAHVWTPYEFWFKGVFHHCGVNSFQLFKDKVSWKIIYLIDTRRIKGCFPETE